MMQTSVLNIQPARVAAVAPAMQDEDVMPAQSLQDAQLDEFCERWVWWVYSRRFYAPSPSLGNNILAKLRGRTRPPIQRDTANSPELAAFHLAYCGQPDALDKQVFELYYVHRVKPVKLAADALGISRKHFYTVLGDFRRRVYHASHSVLQANLAMQPKHLVN